jgi:RNA polymerase sigma-70 factor, ECF subfamily
LKNTQAQHLSMEKTEKLVNSVPTDKSEIEPPNLLDVRLGKAKLGDSAAFSGIYDEYAARIYNFASRMVGSREDAEDITQDTFFLAFQKLKDLREHLHFEQWLYRIARNEIYKRQRKIKFKPDSLDDEEKGFSHILKSTDSEGNPENRMLSAELGRKAKAILNALPITYKETLVLATLQGLNYQDIAQIQGRSLSSIKTDVYRARLIISEKMRKYTNP